MLTWLVLLSQPQGLDYGNQCTHNFVLLKAVGTQVSGEYEICSITNFLVTQIISHRCNHFTEPPRQLPFQHQQNPNNTYREWKSIEVGVHPLCCLGLWYHHLPLRLRQDQRWGRDNLDGQQLRLLLQRPIWFLVLPATNYHNENQHSGNILPHEWRWYKAWMESRLERGDARFEGFHSNSIFHPF